MKNQPSVHLCDFPNLSFIKVEKDIVEKMDGHFKEETYPEFDPQAYNQNVYAEFERAIQ